jgi:predicted short-subunit dehydrogenase-like oxidoreductase (DUF2520 family)
MARALKRAGYSIDLVVARRASSAKRAAKILGPSVQSATIGQLFKRRKLLSSSNLILICTPDDEIERVAQQIAKVLSECSVTDRATALHASGALPSKVLKPLKDIGFAIGSIHPLISIADINSPVSIFSGAYFSVEGDRAAVQAARLIVKALGGHGFTIGTKMKPLYHAAAVMASGNVVALYDVAIGMMKQCGLSAKKAGEALMPLLATAVDNLKVNSPTDALTGPFARRDIETARKHLNSLAENDLSEATAIYLALARHALKMAASKNSSSANADAIAKLLSQFQHTGAR